MRKSQNHSDDPVMSNLRLPPHSLEAEQSLLGGLLIDTTVWDRVGDVVNEADFYRADHRRIFRQLARLIELGKPADVVTVFEALEKNGEAEHVGGLSYLGEIANSTPSAANVRRYGEIIRERAILRKLVSVGDDIAASALTPSGKDAKTLLDEAEAKVFEIAEAGARTVSGFVPIQPILGQVDLDDKTSGLQPSDMIVLAARPGMGKTSLALNIAEHVAIEGGLPVAVFSMEMPGTQLATRFLSSVGRIDQQQTRSGKLNDEEWQRLTYALGKLHEAPIFIDETPGLNPTDLRARCRRLHRQCGRLGLIVIDYLQLMTSLKESDNRSAELSEISRSVKSLAKELHVPIIALSQLNRSLEQRPNKRPVATDLRESGAIEQDADIIMFIYRDEIYNPDSPDKGREELIISKHRNGSTGTIRMTFLGEFTRFENYAGAPSY